MSLQTAVNRDEPDHGARLSVIGRLRLKFMTESDLASNVDFGVDLLGRPAAPQLRPQTRLHLQILRKNGSYPQMLFSSA
ncbi:hypothetical protein [Tabrizicola sp.]|uniref:hypothetical protein n=1 Tax=Tabrizicola sp. TaxID=2005166 RepID=UPI002617AD03|nr:hypothetical protein [Tabrizicola sp.]MDM7933653.1 hypothetical protein [Tabrizicola sp.]